MKLNMGTIRSNLSGFDCVADITKQTRALFLDSVELDFSYCKFFEANMAAPLYSVIARLRDELNDVSINNMHSSVETILRKNRFLTVFNQPKLIDYNQTTLPFKIFKLTAGEQFNDYLSRYMKGKGIPTMSEALTKRFRQSLLEIFLNAAIHSKSKSGIFVCGQFYPQKHRMDFTIADAGIGIRENVRSFTGKKVSSIIALKWALMDGHTTKKGNLPGGLGLKLLKDFIRLNKGKLQIVSRFAYYEFTAVNELYEKMNSDFPGTCVNIEINTEDRSSYCLGSELNNDNIF